MLAGLVPKVALILGLGVTAQWAAWRYQIPSIVLLSVAGILAGPVGGVLDPAVDLGPVLQPAVAIAVAVILFEGGLNLDVGNLRGAASAVWRLILIGAPLAWALGAAAAHLVGGLSLPVAILFGGILVVTGPTVIAPLLRQARLKHRPAAVLQWEGIVNDPVGALFAVITYEVVVHSARFGGGSASLGMLATELVAAAAAAAVLGSVAGWALAQGLRRGLVPEFLKAPLLLAGILVTFAASNLIYDETGLLAVTAMGMVVGNSRIAAIEELRRFKENVAVVLVSGVFVLLTATLDWSHVQALTWRHAAFVVAILVLVRPLTVLISTVGSGLPGRERLLVAWIAPRGIIAVAVSGLFAGKLAAQGHADAALLVPLSFAIVFTTVVVHGFTLRPLARVLDLVSTEKPGILVVGATPWTQALATALGEMKVPVIVADTEWYRLASLRQAGVPTYYGEVLSEVTEHHLELSAFGHLVAATENDAYNALVCTDLAPELGRSNVYQTGCHEGPDHPRRRSFTLGGRTLLRSGADTDDLNRRIRAGWSFQKTRLTNAFDLDAWRDSRPEGAEILLVQEAGGRIVFATSRERPKAAAGDTVLALTPPEG